MFLVGIRPAAGGSAIRQRGRGADKKHRAVGTSAPRSSSMSSRHHPWWPFRPAGCLARVATSSPTMRFAIAQDCARLRRSCAGRSGWRRAAWGSADAGKEGSAATGSGEMDRQGSPAGDNQLQSSDFAPGSPVTDPGTAARSAKTLGPADHPARPGQTEHRI